jgi:hypothetical protein
MVKQVVTIPNSYQGIVFDPSGQAFYVSSGMGDYPYAGSPYTAAHYNPSQAGLDNIHTFARATAEALGWSSPNSS